MAAPTRKGVALAAGAVILFMIGANIQAGWLYVLGASLAGVVIAGVILPRSALRRLSFTRAAPSTARVGEEVEVSLRVLGAVRGPFHGHDSFLGGYGFLAEGSSDAALETVVLPSRRGIYSGGRITVVSGFPFGLGKATRTDEVSGDIIVHPHWVDLASLPVLEAASAPNEAFHDRRRRGGGLDFFGIREYRPGDSLRHVHWRSTARGGRLLVREYEEQPAARLALLLHARGPIGEEPNTTFEDAVSCAASFALYALGAGHPVALFSDSAAGMKTLLDPTRAEMLDWLAEVEPSGRQGLLQATEDMAGAVFRRATSALIFPSTKQVAGEAEAAVSFLQSLSARVLAVVLSARTYAPRNSDALSDRDEEELIEALAARRAIVYRVEKDEELSSCLREPIHIPA